MRHEIRLEVKPPFHLEASVRVLQRRDRNPVDRWDGEYWSGVVRVGGRPVVARLRNAGDVDRPDVRLETSSEQAAPMVRARLGLDVDPSPLAGAIAVLPGAEALLARLRGLRPPRYGTAFESALSVIPFQQVSLDAGISIYERLVRRYGHRHRAGSDECFAMPLAGELVDADVDDLRSLGLSHAKGRAIVGCARALLDGAIDEAWLQTAPLPEALGKLKTLPGIGPWSAHLMMLRGFGRLDAFPPGDSGVAKSLTILTGQPVTAADAVALGRRLEGSAGWFYYLSLASSLVAKGVL